MSKFLKLTKLMINTKYIHSIIIEPNKYSILVTSNQIEGTNLSFIGFGFGRIASYHSEIIVSKTQDSSDYKIITDWINNH